MISIVRLLGTSEEFDFLSVGFDLQGRTIQRPVSLPCAISFQSIPSSLPSFFSSRYPSIPVSRAVLFLVFDLPALLLEEVVHCATRVTSVRAVLK